MARAPVRPLPPPTWEVVFPPHDLHPLLQEFAHHPFDAAADTFAPVNAWWLAELSLLAYSPAEAARRAWDAMGLPAAGWELEQVEASLIAFRGTQVLRPGPGWDGALRNLETDADLLLGPWAGTGRVHRGWRTPCSAW